MRLPINHFSPFEGRQRSTLDTMLQETQSNILAGRPIPGDKQAARGANIRWFPLQATTPSTPDEEFSIEHGLGNTPYNLIPCMPLDESGWQLVRLTVTRPADNKRVWLSSPDADAPIMVFVETPIS